MSARPRLIRSLFAIAASFLMLDATRAADPLEPASYLEKLAQRLTGAWPTPEEYESLEKAMQDSGCRESSCLDSFFSAYIDQKMSTPEFYSEATLKTFERFSFRTPKRPSFPMLRTEMRSGAAELAIYLAFRDNRPIDDLYLSQTITRPAYESQSPYFAWPIEESAPTETRLFSFEDAAVGPIEVRQAEYAGHPNVAGLFSTSTFAERYWNSPVNQGRKRAAAFFRILLCDSMSPALERGAMREREEALARGVPDAPLTQRAIEEIHRNRHAAQADCALCHARLDPVARAMRPIEQGISNFAAPGRLRLADGSVDAPAPNFHALVQAATRVPKYVDCQLNWLVTWIIGRDARIHPERFAEMLREFGASNRRLKTTISALLRSPEFRGETPTIAEPPSMTRARDVLRNCEECHASTFTMRGDLLKQRLGRIATRLDLAHGGARRTMPPANHWWAPTAADLETVRSWLRDGAPLAQGRPPLLTPQEAATILTPRPAPRAGGGTSR